MNTLLSIYERLGLMAVASARVVEKSSLPGAIRHSVDTSVWTEVDGSSVNCLETWVDSSQAEATFRDNLVVAITRFVYDHTVVVADLLNHSFVDGSRLPGWREESQNRWPPQGRHSGWTMQTGTYNADGQQLWMANAYAVHERGNVGYLLQVTATVAADGPRGGDRAGLVEWVQSARFED